jgi:UDP-glucose 4-epimerase
VRVVVVGATGNVGTSLLGALSADPDVESVLGLARRLPRLRMPKVAWAVADITRDELAPRFRGADAVVHLAWAIQPSHDSTRGSSLESSARARCACRAPLLAGQPL